MSSQRNFKILLVLANSPMDTLIPPNVSILSACLKRAGLQVRLFDTTFYPTREKTGDDARIETLQVKRTDFSEMGILMATTNMVEDFKAVVEEYQPDLIGLSAVESTYRIGLKLLRRLRPKKVLTIVGGVHATMVPEEVIAEDCVDMVCIGEGDEALVELASKLYKNEDIRDIKNLWVKVDGKVYKNPVRPPVNLDELPFQDWSIYDLHRLMKPMGGKIRTTGCFELNRGCPYRCTFCCADSFHKLYNNRYYRERSVERFIAEIAYFKEHYDLQYIYVSAESFLVTSNERFMKFIRLYERLNLPFWIETRPESLTTEKIRLLESVGCESISTGIESGDEKMRRELLNRHVSNDQILAAFEALRQFSNIRSCANNIIGFPDETREQIFKTIELNRQANPKNIMVHVFNPYRGTKLWKLCVEKGYVDRHSLAGDYRSDVLTNMPTLSSAEIRGLQRTFVLYARLPYERYPEIAECEKFTPEGNKKFQQLADEYTRKHFL